VHIALDAELCQAYGNCMLAAPDFFELTGSEPIVAVLSPDPPETARGQVEEAVLSCPVQALTVLER
jgi:ferredoxin